MDVLAVERQSILVFMESCVEYFQGDVLDYGCGKEPYYHLTRNDRSRYTAYDRRSHPANVSEVDLGPDHPLDTEAAWDTIVCNQVIQYIPDPFALLCDFNYALKPGGALVITGPTNWREIEPDDLYRFTLRGIIHLLHEAGFDHLPRCEQRARIPVAPGFLFSLGWGAVALRPV